MLKRKPRSPRERIFNRLMIERTVVAAAVMGGVAFAAFAWMLDAGWTEAEARNALLLLLVLFQNVHIGNCRSETTSALRRSPLHSPILMAGVLSAFLIHVAAMHLPVGASLLGTGPLDSSTWILLVALALVILPAMELHKLSWAWRQRRRRTGPS